MAFVAWRGGSKYSTTGDVVICCFQDQNIQNIDGTQLIAMTHATPAMTIINISAYMPSVFGLGGGHIEWIILQLLKTKRSKLGIASRLVFVG